jgi:hypothetical protein
MDFCSSAHSWMVGCVCHTCDLEIAAGQPVRYDVDGGYGDDGTQTRTRIEHVTCPENEAA